MEPTRRLVCVQVSCGVEQRVFPDRSYMPHAETVLCYSCCAVAASRSPKIILFDSIATRKTIRVDPTDSIRQLELTLTLIQPAAKWMHWATLRRHSDLF